MIRMDVNIDTLEAAMSRLREKAEDATPIMPVRGRAGIGGYTCL